MEDFKQFGEVGDFYRPMNLSKKKPTPFAFIRYFRKDDAEEAKEAMNGRLYAYKRITVHDANAQDSFFTQDTGFITNQMFDVPVVKVDNFDPSLPEEHYIIKRQREVKYADNVHNIRIDDLPTDIRYVDKASLTAYYSDAKLPPLLSKEELANVFGQFGEISSIYYPVDLKTLKAKGFAFIRYLSKDSAERAIQSMHLQTIGTSRPLNVRFERSRTYFGQDESPYFK